MPSRSPIWLGAEIIRVFSYWRTTQPEQCYPQLRDALIALADEAAARGVVIGSRTSTPATSAPAPRRRGSCRRLITPRCRWYRDPANASILGETPFPAGYHQLQASRIGHVHAKDCHVTDHKPVWGAVGEMGIDWRGQIEALRRDGYRGWISLETHLDRAQWRQVRGQYDLWKEFAATGELVLPTPAAKSITRGKEARNLNFLET